MDDLEDMMMMEAIRLSLASEEERRRKEDKDAKKKAKKDEKERKKEEKAARKNSLFTMNSNTSNADGASSFMERSRSNLSSLADEDDDASGKGKGVQRPRTPPLDGGSRVEEETPKASYLPELSLSGTSQESLAPSIPIPTAAEPFRRSHLRQMSNASSASSSIVEPGPTGSFPGSSTPPPGSLEPMFNFQSLAAMIGEDEKGEKMSHVEDADGELDSGSGIQTSFQGRDEARINEDGEAVPSGANGTALPQREKAPVQTQTGDVTESESLRG